MRLIMALLTITMLGSGVVCGLTTAERKYKKALNDKHLSKQEVSNLFGHTKKIIRKTFHQKTITDNDVSEKVLLEIFGSSICLVLEENEMLFFETKVKKIVSDIQSAWVFPAKQKSYRRLLAILKAFIYQTLTEWIESISLQDFEYRFLSDTKEVIYPEGFIKDGDNQDDSILDKTQAPDPFSNPELEAMGFWGD